MAMPLKSNAQQQGRCCLCWHSRDSGLQKPENNLKCFYLQLTLNAIPKPFCMAQSAPNRRLTLCATLTSSQALLFVVTKLRPKRTSKQRNFTKVTLPAACKAIPSVCASYAKSGLHQRFFTPLEPDLNQPPFSATVWIFRPDFAPAIVYPAPGIF